MQSFQKILLRSIPLCIVLCGLFLVSTALRGQNAVISGVVSEAASGEVVIGVNVMLSKDSLSSSSAALVRGARTNKFGFYSLPNIPEGTFFLMVRGIGYKTYVKRIVIGKPDETLRQNIPLAAQNVRSGEVTVQADRQSSSPTKDISAVELKSDFIAKMPSLGGETDIFRVLQLMPGIKSGGEASSGLYVRGGSPDQNLILLDGVTVYNPSHLGGILSTFNNDAIRDVRVMKGAFPAEYGGRLSSVIDLTMKEGSKEKLSGAANLSLIAARLTLEGPIGEDASFMVSGRRTYFDVLANAIGFTGFPTYYFYDLNAKLNYKIGENDRIYASGYFGNDILTQPSGSALNFGLDWGNATGSFRWSHIVSPNLFTNFSAIYTDYRYGFNIGGGAQASAGDLGFTSFSQIRDIAVKADMQYFPTQEHTVKAGVEATYHRFTTLAESSNRTLAAVLDQIGGNTTINALEAAIYAQDEWQITPQLSANLGLRLSYFQLGNRLLPEPRASLSYALSDEVSLKGAFAVSNQFLHLIVRNDISLPTDTWFPATENIKPANGVQYVLGAEAYLFDREWQVSLEGYYKTLQNVYEFRDDAAFGLFAPAESQLTEGIGDAYGVEFFLNKRIGALTGWIGYTLSWTTRTFAELNGGKPYFPRYDRRHDISIVLNYKISDAWEVGATWQYATGQAFTMPSGQYSYPNFDSQRLIPSQRINYTQRNGFTAPDFHNLGLSATHYFTWFNLPFNAGLSIYNAYNRQNPFSVAVSYTVDPKTQVLVPAVTQTSLFPIIPTLSIGFKF